jgi:hypothetical protein
MPAVIVNLPQNVVAPCGQFGHAIIEQHQVTQ